MSESLLKTYFQFLRSPVLDSPAEILPRAKARNRILRLYCLHLPLVIVIGSIINYALTRFFNGIDSNKLTEIFDSTDSIALVFLFVVVTVFVPVLEECIFRLPLKSFAVNLALSGCLAIWFFLPRFTGLVETFLFFLGSMLAGLTIYLWSKESKVIIFQQLYRRYPRVIFYFAALLFGIVHIGNYESQVWLLLPLLVLPQVIIGLWLGFVRLRYGFWWGVFAHGFHNGCVLLPMGLLKLSGADRLQSQNLAITNINDLPLLNLLVMGGVVFYVLAGLALCGIVTWKMFGEWMRSH